MTMRDRLLALLCVALWGVQFAVAHVALRDCGPILLVALRFAPIALLTVLFVPRPQVSWRRIIAIGASLGVLEFGLLFLAMGVGLPAGLSSLVMQSSAPFTVLLSTLVLRQRPAPVVWLGLCTCVGGLVVVAVDRSSAVAWLALLLALGSGASWAVGNVLSAQARCQEPFALSLWSSIVTPIPMLVGAVIFEGPARTLHTLDLLASPPGWRLWLCLLYLSALSSAVAAGIWTVLLTKHPAHDVAPMSTLVPVIGTLAGHFAFGESITPGFVIGGVLMLAGLIMISAGPRTPRRGRAVEQSQ